MQDITSNEEDKYQRARKRVETIKSFYIHLTVYLVINAVILMIIFISTQDKNESFWQAGHFFTLIFWGIGLAFHAALTFNINPFFGKKWEERQIRKYMEKDKKESQKYH